MYFRAYYIIYVYYDVVLAVEIAASWYATSGLEPQPLWADAENHAYTTAIYSNNYKTTQAMRLQLLVQPPRLQLAVLRRNSASMGSQAISTRPT